MFTTHTEQLFKRAIYFELGLAQHALIFTLHDLLNPWDLLEEELPEVYEKSLSFPATAAAALVGLDKITSSVF